MYIIFNYKIKKLLIMENKEFKVIDVVSRAPNR